MIKLSSLIETRSPYPPATIKDKNRGYIGIVDNGRVLGYTEMLPNPLEVDHSEIDGFFGSDGFRKTYSGRFRYFVENPKNTVMWTNNPSDEDKHKAEDWLYRSGVKNPKHVDFYTYQLLKSKTNENTMLLKTLLREGVKETAVEDYLKNLIKETEWENFIFIAGGYVRDFVMGKDPKDLDLMVNKPNGGIEFADWVTKKIGNYKNGSNPVIFPRFGTAKFNLNGITHNGIDLSGMDIETVMPRSETYTVGSRKPEVGVSSLQGDAERRDLTVNALFKNLSTGEILDPTGKGMGDIKKGIVRTPLDPTKTFTDDPLRMLRVIRFYAKYKGIFLPMHIIRALKQNAHQLENISSERINEELNKMLMTSNPDKAVKLLKVTNLLQYIIPELKSAIKMTQNVHHSMDVFNHTLEVLKKTQPVLVQRLMGLFHDIGKTVTRSVTPTGVHFYGHEHAGAEMAEQIMKRLKYPNEIISAVKTGVANHMRLKHGGDTAVDISDKTLRKFVTEVGDQLENILGLIHADNIAHSEASSMPNQIEFVKNRLKSIETTTSKPKLPITGFDLQKELGLKPGPIFSEIMKAITDAWFETPKLNKSEALEIAQKISGDTEKF